MVRIIIEGNAVYEVDEECLKRKAQKEQKQEKDEKNEECQ